MICPKCAANTRVARSEKKGGAVIRYRYCPECGYTVPTKEVPVFHLFSQEEIKEYEEYVDESLAESQKSHKR